MSIRALNPSLLPFPVLPCPLTPEVHLAMPSHTASLKLAKKMCSAAKVRGQTTHPQGAVNYAAGGFWPAPLDEHCDGFPALNTQTKNKTKDGKTKAIRPNGLSKAGVHLVRYADDFVVTAVSTVRLSVWFPRWGHSLNSLTLLGCSECISAKTHPVLPLGKIGQGTGLHGGEEGGEMDPPPPPPHTHTHTLSPYPDLAKPVTGQHCPPPSPSNV